MIRYTYAVVMQNARNKVSRANGGKCDIHKANVLWSVLPATYTRSCAQEDATARLGTHAFHAVLSRRFELYNSSLLKPLAFELALPRNQRIRRRFRGIVKESSAIMAIIGL